MTMWYVVTFTLSSNLPAQGYLSISAEVSNHEEEDEEHVEDVSETDPDLHYLIGEENRCKKDRILVHLG